MQTEPVMGRNDQIEAAGQRRTRRPILALTLAAIIALASFSEATAAAQGKPVGQGRVCDVNADYFLGIEEYHTAIRLHRKIVDSDPGNALAHYHLGFAYGMVGRRTAEEREYLRAVGLGLKEWDLFLNLGLAYLEDSDVGKAADVLRSAAALAPDRPEVHFDLALVYERSGMQRAALQEILTSLRLDPNQPDARNTLAVIYAKAGDYERAHKEWSDLVRNYAAAQANLAMLEHAYRLPDMPWPSVIDRSAPHPARTKSGLIP